MKKLMFGLLLCFVFFPLSVSAEGLAVTLQSDHAEDEVVMVGDVITYTIVLSGGTQDFKGKVTYPEEAFELLAVTLSSEWKGESSLASINVTREEVLPATSVLSFQLKVKKSLDTTERVVLSEIKSGEDTVEEQYQYVRIASDNCYLASLMVENGVLGQPFQPEVFEYEVTVPLGVETVLISSTLQHNFASYLEGSSSQMEIPFGEEKKDVRIQVKSQQGRVQDYLFHLVREKNLLSSNHRLKKLILSAGLIDFDPEVYEYQVRVPYEIGNIAVQTMCEDAKSGIEITGEGSLAVGENVLQVTVTAENKETSTYTVTIVREEEKENSTSGSNLLRSLTVSGIKFSFDSNTFEYRLPVVDFSNLDIQAIPIIPEAVVRIQGNYDLQVGSVVSIIVTGENQQNQEYRLILEQGEKKPDSMWQNPVVWGAIVVLILGGGTLVGSLSYAHSRKKRNKK